jgi:uncharacterized OB-fold protein
MTSDVHNLAEFRPFFEGLRSKQIRFPKCCRCHRVHWYPMKLCPHCLGAEFEWPAISGAGRLYSWTVVRRPFSADYAEKVPYIVGLVSFDEVPGTRLISNIIECRPEELTVDAPLTPAFDDGGDGPPTVRFLLARNNRRMG